MRTISRKCLLMPHLIILILMFLTPNLVLGYNLKEEERTDEKIAENNSVEFDMMDDWENGVLENYLSLRPKWGFNGAIKEPKEKDMKVKFWSSRTLGIDLCYNIPIKNSHFIISPGIGLSHGDYLSENKKTFTRKSTNFDKTIIKSASTLLNKRAREEVKKSYFSFWTIDFMPEIGFTSNKEESNEGFFCAVGGNIGMNLSPNARIIYSEDKEDKEMIIKESFNLAKIRYGLFGRIGWGRFGAFYHQIFSPIFNENGPDQSTMVYTIGLSIDLL